MSTIRLCLRRADGAGSRVVGSFSLESIQGDQTAVDNDRDVR